MCIRDRECQRRNRQTLHGLVVHMVDNCDVVQAELLDVFLHRAAVVLVVLHRNDRTLARDDRGLDRDRLARDNAHGIVRRNVHFV